MQILDNKKEPKKEVPSSGQPDKYQEAYLEWSQRIGTARVQTRNWRLAFLLTLAMVVLLVISIVFALSWHRTYIYVAQVGPGQNINNLVPVDRSYSPTEAQEEYFIGQFISNIVSLPLDPVVARNNWLNAYTTVSGQAVTQLTDYARSVDPFHGVGDITKSVKIEDFHPVSDHSYEFTFTQTVYDGEGKVSKVSTLSGIFTVAKGPMPTDPQALLVNPFGLKIVYFSFSNKE